jgi:hypothetical protein
MASSKPVVTLKIVIVFFINSSAKCYEHF